MPYTSVEDLPDKLKKLPIKAKTIFMNAFNASFEEFGEERAFRIAWSAVKKKYRREENKWVKKLKGSFGNTREYRMKTDLSGAKAHYADFKFGDTKMDLDGDVVPVKALYTKLDGMAGTLEHATVYDEEYIKEYGHNPFEDDKDLFEVKDSFFSGEDLIGTVKFKNEHPLFQEVWALIKSGEFGISLEYDVDEDGNWVVVGISGVKKPRNERSKIISAYTADE